MASRITRADVVRVADSVRKRLGFETVSVYAGTSAYGYAWRVEFRRAGADLADAPDHWVTVTRRDHTAREAYDFLTAYAAGIDDAARHGAH